MTTKKIAPPIRHEQQGDRTKRYQNDKHIRQAKRNGKHIERYENQQAKKRQEAANNNDACRNDKQNETSNGKHYSPIKRDEKRHETQTSK